jgi:hypothetical protein
MEDDVIEPDAVSAEVAEATALLPLETVMGLQGPALTTVIPKPARPATIFLELTMIDCKIKRATAMRRNGFQGKVYGNSFILLV